MLVEGVKVERTLSSIGFGLKATRRIEAGELIWRESDMTRARCLTWREVCDIPEPYRSTFKHFMYQTGADSFESAREFDDLPRERWHEVSPADTSLYMNHSCDPSCWYTHPQALEMCARRLILPGEWITYDYAMSECIDDQAFECRCGSRNCRGRINGSDWRIPALRKAYWGHVAQHVQELMKTVELPAREACN